MRCESVRGQELGWAVDGGGPSGGGYEGHSFLITGHPFLIHPPPHSHLVWTQLPTSPLLIIRPAARWLCSRTGCSSPRSKRCRDRYVDAFRKGVAVLIIGYPTCQYLSAVRSAACTLPTGHSSDEPPVPTMSCPPLPAPRRSLF